MAVLMEQAKIGTTGLVSYLTYCCFVIQGYTESWGHTCSFRGHFPAQQSQQREPKRINRAISGEVILWLSKTILASV